MYACSFSINVADDTKDKLTIGKTNMPSTAKADTKHKLSLNIDAKFEVYIYFLTFTN